MPIVHMPSRTAETEQHPPTVRPLIEGSRRELSIVINGDGVWLAASGDRPIKRVRHGLPRHTVSHLQDGTPATPLINDRQHAKRSSVDQCVMHEIHAPALV